MQKTINAPAPDPLNYCVVRIQSFYNDTELAKATGFFYGGTIDGKLTHWLVTNWHVISGRNASNPSLVLHHQAGLPNRLRFEVASARDRDGRETAGMVFLHEHFVQLYNGQSQAGWYQHPQKNLVDIAVINLGDALIATLAQGVSKFATENDMAIEIGNDIFILGYPLGFSHFMKTPIWKRGSIASEPHAETPDSKFKIMIDATTRDGMSGSPVFMRSKTHYLSESGEIKAHANATRFIGVYASRPAPVKAIESNGSEDASYYHELGYVYKSSLVHDVIVKGIRGPNFEELP